MNCKECGNKISEGAAFCDKCGSAVGENAQQAVPQQQNTPQLPKKKKGKGCLVSVLAVVGFFIIVMILISIFNNDSEEGESATPDTRQSTTDDISDDGGIVSDDTNNDNAIDASQKNDNDTDNVSLVNIPDGGIVMFDEDGIVVTATQLNRDRDGYVTDIEFTIENSGSVEKSIETVNGSWVSRAVKVNNYSFPDKLESTVAAGKAAKEKLELSSDDVKLFNLRNVSSVTLEFEIDDVKYAPSTIRIDGSADVSFDGGDLVLSNQDVDIYACGFDSGWSSTDAVFVVKNKTGKGAWFGIESVSANGFMNDAWGQGDRGDIYNNTYRVLRVTLEDEYNKDNVKEIEFTLRTGQFQSVVPSSKDDIAIVTVAY